MKDCIFCKIVSGEIDSVRIWEDDDYLAILDVNPNTKGMTLVITKEHFDSDVFLMPDQTYQNFFLAAKKVVKLLEKGLKVQRVSLAEEGMGINHAHIKLYPLYGLNEKFKETWAKEKIYFEKYEGYISTQLGPKKSIEELRMVKNEIVENIKNEK